MREVVIGGRGGKSLAMAELVAMSMAAQGRDVGVATAMARSGNEVKPGERRGAPPSTRQRCPKCGGRGKRRRVRLHGAKRRVWTCARCEP